MHPSPLLATATPVLFRPGNTKLSGGKKTIWGFGVPSRHTCPARTPTCTRLCYSHRLEKFRPNVAAVARTNLQVTKSAEFVTLAVAEIRRKKIPVLRVHTGGELYSVAYAQKWLAVFEACPDTRFFIWTRCWRLPRFRPVLRRMAALANVRLWFSCDKDTGVPGSVPARVRLAYMQVAADDLPPRGDLVFRAHHLRAAPATRVVAGRAGNPAVKICPTETGLPGHEDVTCTSCRACWTGLPGDPKLGRIPLALV